MNEKVNVKAIENLQYMVLIGLILAQCVIGKVYLVGQSIYLACNLISSFRCVALRRPRADLVKDLCCLAITVGLIVIYLI